MEKIQQTPIIAIIEDGMCLDMVLLHLIGVGRKACMFPFVFSSMLRNPVSQRRKKMKLSIIADGLLVMLPVVTFSSAMKSSEFQITADSSIQQYPAIYGNIAVWDDDRNGNWDIFGYDLLTGKEFQITDNPDVQQRPKIFGDSRKTREG